jgi:hypothetical protein
MVRNLPHRQSISQRQEAMQLARGNPARALELARRIPDGWYRAQALAHIAFGAPDSIADVAFAEAIAAAKTGPDAYQQVAVLRWVIMAALERGDAKRAKQVVGIALAAIPSVEPPPSRAMALGMLLEAASRLPNLREKVIAATLMHLPPERCHYFWRARRVYRAIALTLVEHDAPAAARAFIETLPAGKVRDRIARRIGAQIAERDRLAALAGASAFQR